MQPSSPALQIENLNVWYGRGASAVNVLKDVSLTVSPGERLGLVGESGSGKTTTILAAMGLLSSSAEVSGRILLNGQDILQGGDASVGRYRWKDIAMVFQGAMNAFNPVKTIGWQITEALHFHGIAQGKAASARVAELLDLVGIPAAAATLYPHQLSGGMKQRAMIAMALSCNPRVLLADEPTTALDVMVQDQILKLLVRLSHELDLAVVLVTHDLGVVAQTCDRAAVMKNGEVVETGTVPDLYHRPAHPYTRELFNATPSLSALRPASSPKPGDGRLLEVEGLHVSYPGPTTIRSVLRRDAAAEKQAVRGVSLDLRAGELLALVGQSGSGKTSIMQAIVGMEKAKTGTIRILGQEVTGLDRRRWQGLRRQVQMIYQDPYEALDNRFRVHETVAEPLRIHGLPSNMAIISAALERVGLKPAAQFLNRYPHELSGGQRQRVSIAAGLVLAPALLLADEPVSMLDVSVRAGILDLLSGLCRDGQMGVLMITHDLSTAALYADRIAVMHDGLIVEQGATRDIIQTPKTDYTRALLASIPNPDPDAGRYV